MIEYFRCQFGLCGFSFQNAEDARRHLRSRHGRDPAPIRDLWPELTSQEMIRLESIRWALAKQHASVREDLRK